MKTFMSHKISGCGEPAISLHSHRVSPVQWVNPLLPVMRDPGSIPRWVLMWNRDSPVSVVLLHGTIFKPYSAKLLVKKTSKPRPKEVKRAPFELWEILMPLAYRNRGKAWLTETNVFFMIPVLFSCSIAVFSVDRQCCLNAATVHIQRCETGCRYHILIRTRANSSQGVCKY